MKQIIIAFFAGMLVLSLGHQVYVNYQLQKQMGQITESYGADHIVLQQIVNLINANRK